jgi:long-chain acyl-CoA synthetase
MPDEPSANVGADLRRSATVTPATAAVVDGATTWSYERLWGEAIAFASTCLARGVAPGDRIAIVAGSWPEHVAAWYGALLAGAVVVDLNVLVGDEEWGVALADCSPAVVACEPAYAPRLRPLLDLDVRPSRLVVLTERGAGIPRDPGSDGVTPVPHVGPWMAPHPGEVLLGRRRDGVAAAMSAADRMSAERIDITARSAGDAAVIAYTSGTTGRPKGVVHTHGGIARQLDLLASLHGLGPGDCVYQAVPLFALHGFLPQVASAVRGGATVVLADKFSAAAFTEASHHHPITYVTLSSPMLQHLIDEPVDGRRPRLEALRVLTVGGAPLQPEQRRRFDEALGVHATQGYGMTEMLGVFVADYGGAPTGSCGRQHPPDPRVVVVLDDDGREVAPGEVGELAVHRSCAFDRYWGDPERTAAAFDGDWFRTGDIGRIDADGYYYVLDRKKDMIIRGGFNIYSAEIERVLAERPGVAEAVVVGVPDERLGEVPVAFVVLTSADTMDPDGSHDSPGLGETLRAHVERRLGSLKTPVRVTVVAHADLPRNAMGKVLKRELRDRLATGVSGMTG